VLRHFANNRGNAIAVFYPPANKNASPKTTNAQGPARLGALNIHLRNILIIKPPFQPEGILGIIAIGFENLRHLTLHVEVGVQDGYIPP
jgi:hypothetical protein